MSHVSIVFFLLVSLSLSVCACVQFPFSYEDKQCPLGMSLLLVSPLLFLSVYFASILFSPPLFPSSSFLSSSPYLFDPLVLTQCALFSYLPLFIASLPFSSGMVAEAVKRQRRRELEHGRHTKREKEKGFTCPKKIHLQLR